MRKVFRVNSSNKESGNTLTTMVNEKYLLIYFTQYFNVLKNACVFSFFFLNLFVSFDLNSLNAGVDTQHRN